MQRRIFLAIIGALALLSSAGAAEDSARAYRIGLLNTAGPLADASPFGAALIRSLAQHGYVLGRNLQFERKGAEMQFDRMPRLVAELTDSKVDVIIAFGYPSAIATKGSRIPVVSFTTGDPVGTGLVDSLARPGGNITGISDVAAEATPKRLELLKEIVPDLKRVAMLWNAADAGMVLRYHASEAGARALGIQVQALALRESKDFDGAFAAMVTDRPDAILVVSDALTSLNRARVFEFAAAQHLPAIYELDAHTRAGGLMSFGPDTDESFARVASLVDSILKGRHPSDLPYERPTHLRFVLNLKTATALGLSVPPSLLARADELIE